LIFEWYCRIGEAHLLQSRVDQAIGWLEKSRSANPAVWYVHAWLAAAYALAGDLERARAALVVAQTLQGTDFERSLAHMADRFAAPDIRARFESNIRAGLRKAGWQET
jgi:adenylate cyclase